LSLERAELGIVMVWLRNGWVGCDLQSADEACWTQSS